LLAETHAAPRTGEQRDKVEMNEQPPSVSEFRSVALAICTYRRPASFARVMQTVQRLQIPPAVSMTLVIADNNPEPAWDAYIRTAVEPLGWPVVYGHEPRTGYSSSRNKSIELVLTTDAEVMICTDDDMLLDAGWLTGHLASLQSFGCDVVNGRIFGIRERFAHGDPMPMCGAGNVSFRRRLIDPAGLNLRFDPNYNKLGNEDHVFFSEARRLGAEIRQSDWPVLSNWYGKETMPEDEVINKMYVTATMHHNIVAKARQERGLMPALGSAAKGLAYGLKGTALLAVSGVQKLAGSKTSGRRTELTARKELLKCAGRLTGLSGELKSRQDVRRHDPMAEKDA